jgi:hypothetical protein
MLASCSAYGLAALRPGNEFASFQRGLCIGVAAIALAAVSHAAFAASTIDAGALASLKKLDPGARLEQRCDMEAMARIDHDKKGYQPERVVASATADTTVDGDALVGKGAAVRSKGKWYRLSFVCKTSSDHMSVLSFDYKIGDAIPKESWEEYNLFD